MATETTTGLSKHIRGITVTTLATLAGVAAALISGVAFGTTPEAASDVRALAVFATLVLVQFPVLKAIGVDIDDFGPKDYLYIAFMTFTLWFITFAIILTAGVTF